jgi:hypothetical protein
MYKFPIKDRVPTNISSIYSYHIKTIGFNSLITNWFQQVLKQHSIVTTTCIDDLHLIAPFIMQYAINSLTPTISKTYDLSNDYIYKITSIHFEHYTNLNPTFKLFHKDESNITCRILVQQNSDECFIIFDDNIKYRLQEGDLVIYSNKLHYTIEYSTNICPVFLVFNIDIYHENNANMYGNWTIENDNRYKDCI